MEYETKPLSPEAKFTGFGKHSFDLESSISNTVSKLNRLQIIYKEADTLKNRSIIGSIYPEKLCFDGNTYRTTKINEVAHLIFLINSK